MAQVVRKTRLDRYPKLFETVRAFYAASNRVPERILSFGCSKGDELITLRKCFPQSEILGCDINLEPFRQRPNPLPFEVFLSTPESLRQHGPFDVVFANSVLCYHPAKGPVPEKFPFREFASLASDIDAVLREGGLFCLFNASYSFSELPFAANYRPVRNPQMWENGFVPRWHSSGVQVSRKLRFLNYRVQHVVRPDLASYWDFRDCIFQKAKGEAQRQDLGRTVREDAPRRQLPAFCWKWLLGGR
jgi:hypothetical protein